MNNKHLPRTKVTKHGTLLYLVYNEQGQPVYVSIPD